ncbi:MAG: NAD(P)H-binding protein [Myxococcales bacterium]|nr:NAD(P)H-binding protein [Myxococcales bacterium]
MTSTLWMAGASGLVGQSVMASLLAEGAPWRVESFGRRALGQTHPRLREHTVDFARFDSGDAAEPAVALCTLGTTLARAGSREAFRAVDFSAVLEFATAAYAHGASRFVLCSAHGADPSSALFYNRVKGEVERAVEDIGFEAVAVVRPSLLLGDRSETRGVERLAIVVSRALKSALGWLPSRPIEAATVARAMVKLAAEAQPGVRVWSNDELHTLGAAPL